MSEAKPNGGSGARRPISCMIAALALALAGCSPGSGRDAAQPDVAGLDMRELMLHVVDPAAFAFWRASGEVVTMEGTQSLLPTTEEGWLVAENGAAQVAEAGNLLAMPGRARDDAEWTAYSRRLTEIGLEAMAAAEARDGAKMFETGGRLYQVCVACHEKYVLPAAEK